MELIIVGKPLETHVFSGFSLLAWMNSESLEPDTPERVVYRSFVYFGIDFGCTYAGMPQDVLDGGEWQVIIQQKSSCRMSGSVKGDRLLST